MFPLDNVYFVLAVVVFIITPIIVSVVLYLLRCKRRSKHPYIDGMKKIKVLLVLGSGGHTTELLRLVSHLDHKRYFYRSYIIADSDKLSQTKMKVAEANFLNGSFEIHYITRARKVHQSYSSSVLTTLLSIYESLRIVWLTEPDLVLTTGPGTCIPVCVSAFILDIFCIKSCYIVFIESVCRVQSLSMSAIILFYSRMADKIVVQWPELKAKYPSTDYIGLL